MVGWLVGLVRGGDGEGGGCRSRDRDRDRDGGWEVGCGLWVVGAITGRSSINRGQRSAVSKLTSMCRLGVLPSRDLWKSTIVNF